MIENLTLSELITVAAAGAFGSLVKDVLTDNCIQIPEIKDKKLYLGALGGAIVGAFVGIVVDGTFLTALMAGYTGTSIVTKLVGPTKREEIIREDNKEVV